MEKKKKKGFEHLKGRKNIKINRYVQEKLESYLQLAIPPPPKKNKPQKQTPKYPKYESPEGSIKIRNSKYEI